MGGVNVGGEGGLYLGSKIAQMQVLVYPHQALHCASEVGLQIMEGQMHCNLLKGGCQKPFS